MSDADDTATESVVQVVDRPDAGHFEVLVDGVHAGLTEYRPEGDLRAFPHTEVDDDFQGRGLASTLIRAALDATREAGLQVLPYCPAVAGFIRKHPDYVDLVPTDRRAEFDLA